MEVIVKFLDDAQGKGVPKGAVEVYTTPPSATGDVNAWRLHIHQVNNAMYAYQLSHRFDEGWQLVYPILATKASSKEQYQRWLFKNVEWIEVDARRIFPPQSKQALESMLSQMS